MSKFKILPLNLFLTNKKETEAFLSNVKEQTQKKKILSDVQSTEKSTSLDEMQDLLAGSSEPLDLKLSTLDLFDKIKSRHS